MRVLAVHPGPLMYTRIFLRLEPLGLELVAAAVRAGGARGAADRPAGRKPRRLLRLVRRSGGPTSIAVLVQLPGQRPGDRRPGQGDEGARCRDALICVGGHSASFVAGALIEHAEGAIDCVISGEGEAAAPLLLAAIEAGGDLAAVPGAVTAGGRGPAARLRRIRSTICCRRAICCATAANISSACSTRAPRSSSRAAARGTARSAAPGRSTAAAIGMMQPERIGRGPGVDPRAGRVHRRRRRVHPRASTAWPSARRSPAPASSKHYYLETRGDVLLRNKEVFRFWKQLGLEYMFLGLEAIDEEGLQEVPQAGARSARNFEALEFARSLGIHVAINLIADPDWDRRAVRASSASGASRSPRSSTSASTRPIRAPRAGSPRNAG